MLVAFRFCSSQLGFRVPLVAISPFAKQHYVSHIVGDHTSILALIEKRFLPAPGGEGDFDHDDAHLFLTQRDAHASTLEDLFDFNTSPSLSTRLIQALPPATDCTLFRPHLARHRLRSN